MNWSARDLDFDEGKEGALQALARCGRGVRIRAHEVVIEEGVELEDGVTVAGDRVHLGAGTAIRAGSDLRALELAIGPRCDIGAGSRVLVAERLRLEAASSWGAGAEIVCRNFRAGKLLHVGDRFCIGAGGTMESTAEVMMGHRVALGSHCVLNANLPITLADQVGSGDHVALWTSGFHFGHSILDGHAAAYAPIRVERNVWLAYHVTVLPGTTIGHDTIVAAGSVVTRDLPPRCLAAGVPAAVRRTLDPAAPAPAALTSMVEDLLAAWIAQLVWKGWQATSRLSSSSGVRVNVASPDGRSALATLLAPGARPDEPAPGQLHVIVTVEDRPDIEPQGPTAVLELRSRAYRGASFDLAEDLRDFLRRRTIPCGDERPFRSIVPAPFDRLRRMV